MHDHPLDAGIRRHLEVEHQFPTDPAADLDHLTAMHTAGDFGSEHHGPDDPMRRIPTYEDLVGFVSSLQSAMLDIQPKVAAFEQLLPEIRRGMNEMSLALRALETLEKREHEDRINQYGRLDEAVRALPYDSPVATMLTALRLRLDELEARLASSAPGPPQV